MEWLRQAFPGTTQDTLDFVLEQNHGDIVRTVDVLTQAGRRQFRGPATFSNPDQDWETEEELLKVHSAAFSAEDSRLAQIPMILSRLFSTPPITSNFVTFIFREWPTPRPNNMVDITAECFRFVKEQFGRPPSDGTHTVAFLLINLLNYVQEQAGPVMPKYLDISRSISEYKRLPGITPPLRSHLPVQSSTFSCDICVEDRDFTQKIVCSANPPHVGCHTCVSYWVLQRIDRDQSSIKCIMNGMGCTETYSDAELDLLLDPVKRKQLERNDFHAEELQGYFECQHDDCDYAIILQNPNEKTFTCPQCHAITCIPCNACHYPMSCQEYADGGSDLIESARCRVANAIEAAFERVCNKCKVRFLKNNGCNKIYCANCGNVQCYLCSQSITDYSHFGNPPRCHLWDSEAQILEQKVRARDAKIEEILKHNPRLKREDLLVEVD